MNYAEIIVILIMFLSDSFHYFKHYYKKVCLQISIHKFTGICKSSISR